MDTSVYNSPLAVRYASKEMLEIFSDDRKFSTWRKLWVALAESEKELGIDISEEQIAEMKAHLYDIDYEFASVKEREVRHDVMAHVLTYGKACPKAAGIIHLGATSCYVGDNTDVLVMSQAMDLVKRELVTAISSVRDFALKYKDLPSLAYTHFQPAQPTTLGKRATLWLNDLLDDLKALEFERDNLALLGCKGTTGTCASFLELFGGDADKVYKLERLIADKVGFEKVAPVSGQTYSRKVDFNVVGVLSRIAQSAAKFSNDIRLMSHLKEVDEPFENKQIGSSAMAYKRNPMRSERIASLSRYIICDLQNTAITAATQWFERTLDDSANKRIAVPEAFLATDAVLSLLINVIKGLRVYPKRIAKHLNEELPFMLTENILMYCVGKKGGDRQKLHEAIRRHSVAAGLRVKEEGLDNDLLDRIAGDSEFNITAEELNEIMSEGGLTGLASQQTDSYIKGVVDPVLKKYGDLLIQDAADAIKV